MEIMYNTRDGNGKDIVKAVKIKEFPIYPAEYTCTICGQAKTEGCRKKDVVSSSFTDHAYVGDMICPDCTRLFSLYFYSYIVERGEIKLFNVREARDVILREHLTPFKLIVTVSGKKHLFYRCPENLSDSLFAVQLENETIYTTHDRQRELFDFVECLMTIGAPKMALAEGRMPYSVLSRDFGADALAKLQEEIKTSREIQLPLYLGQKRNITEEEATCCITSILRGTTVPAPRS